MSVRELPKAVNRLQKSLNGERIGNHIFRETKLKISLHISYRLIVNCIKNLKCVIGHFKTNIFVQVAIQLFCEKYSVSDTTNQTLKFVHKFTIIQNNLAKLSRNKFCFVRNILTSIEILKIDCIFCQCQFMQCQLLSRMHNLKLSIK